LRVGHEEAGWLGVCFTRAREMPVAEVLQGWEGLAGELAVVFEGGRMQPEAAICLAKARLGASDVSGLSRVSGPVGTVDLSGDPDTLRPELDGLRVFSGYAGWAPA